MTMIIGYSNEFAYFTYKMYKSSKSCVLYSIFSVIKTLWELKLSSFSEKPPDLCHAQLIWPAGPSDLGHAQSRQRKNPQICDMLTHDKGKTIRFVTCSLRTKGKPSDLWHAHSGQRENPQICGMLRCFGLLEHYFFIMSIIFNLIVNLIESLEIEYAKIGYLVKSPIKGYRCGILEQRETFQLFIEEFIMPMIIGYSKEFAYFTYKMYKLAKVVFYTIFYNFITYNAQLVTLYGNLNYISIKSIKIDQKWALFHPKFGLILNLMKIDQNRAKSTKIDQNRPKMSLFSYFIAFFRNLNVRPVLGPKISGFQWFSVD